MGTFGGACSLKSCWLFGGLAVAFVMRLPALLDQPGCCMLIVCQMHFPFFGEAPVSRLPALREPPPPNEKEVLGTLYIKEDQRECMGMQKVHIRCTKGTQKVHVRWLGSQTEIHLVNLVKYSAVWTNAYHVIGFLCGFHGHRKQI